MKISRRDVILAAAFFGLSPDFAPAFAQAYPVRPIRLITPTSAGSGTDILARKIADHFGRSLGKPVYVDNVPGAGGIIGTEKLIASPADGYTLMVVPKNHLILPLINPAVKYDAVRQVTPVCTVVEGTSVLVATPRLPAKTLSEFIAYAKANPGKVNFGTSGVGTTVDLVGRMVQQLAQIDVLNVPYKGVSSLLPDVMSGVVDVAVFSLSAISEQVRSGSLVALGITRSERIPLLPNVPSIREHLHDFNFKGWFAILAPAGLEPGVAKEISDAMLAMQADKTFVEQSAKDGEYPLAMSGPQFAAFFAQEYQRLATLIERLHLKVT